MKNPYGTNGIIDFSRLWELLERRGHNKAWLRANGIHANTIVKLRKNENVTCEVLAHLCHLLDCQVWEILEYKKTENTRKQTIDKYTKIDYNGFIKRKELILNVYYTCKNEN